MVTALCITFDRESIAERDLWLSPCMSINQQYPSVQEWPSPWAAFAALYFQGEEQIAWPCCGFPLWDTASRSNLPFVHPPRQGNCFVRGWGNSLPTSGAVRHQRWKPSDKRCSLASDVHAGVVTLWTWVTSSFWPHDTWTHGSSVGEFERLGFQKMVIESLSYRHLIGINT